MKFIDIFGWVIITPFVLLALFIAVRFLSCGPDIEVVKVASPVVNQIADYIVENRIPESLEDIPGIPYELNECSKKEVYWKNGELTLNKEESDFIELFLNASFMENEKLYRIHIRFEKYDTANWEWSGRLKIHNDASYTGYGLSIETKKKGTLYKASRGRGYSRHHGTICASFKQ